MYKIEKLEKMITRLESANGRLMLSWRIPTVKEAMDIIAEVSIELGEMVEQMEEEIDLMTEQ